MSTMIDFRELLSARRVLHVLAAFVCCVAATGAFVRPAAANPPSEAVVGRATGARPLGFRFGRVISPDAVPFYRDYHDFSNKGSDGNAPLTELVADSKGNLYGTTESGGTYGDGTVYRITLPSVMTGNATYKTIHSFKPGEGAMPQAGVLIGADGGFYGTTYSGGAHGDGTVYRVDPVSFTLKTLHSFNSGATPKDGCAPYGGLVIGSGGLLYGTTGQCGPLGGGTVFAISPKGASVSYATIHAFGGTGDGSRPFQGRLVVNGSELFGTTIFDSNNGIGTVFEMVLSGGVWSEAVIHQFGTIPDDATNPSNSVVIDKSGNLYGCGGGGHYGKGAVFKLTPAGASYTTSIIESFGAHSGEPTGGSCALVLDSIGRLIGTSSGGGTYGGGTVFRLTQSGGTWALATRFSFGPENSTNAYEPISALLGLANGYYVGTAYMGGAFSDGAMFEIKP